MCYNSDQPSYEVLLHLDGGVPLPLVQFVPQLSGVTVLQLYSCKHSIQYPRAFIPPTPLSRKRQVSYYFVKINNIKKHKFIFRRNLNLLVPLRPCLYRELQQRKVLLHPEQHSWNMYIVGAALLKNIYSRSSNPEIYIVGAAILKYIYSRSSNPEIYIVGTAILKNIYSRISNPEIYI